MLRRIHRRLLLWSVVLSAKHDWCLSIHRLASSSVKCIPRPRSSRIKSLVRRHRYPFGLCNRESLKAFCMSECLSIIFHPMITVFIYSSFYENGDQDRHRLLMNGTDVTQCFLRICREIFTNSLRTNADDISHLLPDSTVLQQMVTASTTVIISQT